jgi:hypothetical protein
VDTKSLCSHAAPVAADHYSLKTYVPLETAMVRHERVQAEEEQVTDQHPTIIFMCFYGDYCRVLVSQATAAELHAALAAERARVVALEAQLAKALSLSQ